MNLHWWKVCFMGPFTHTKYILVYSICAVLLQHILCHVTYGSSLNKSIKVLLIKKNCLCCRSQQLCFLKYLFYCTSNCKIHCESGSSADVASGYWPEDHSSVSNGEKGFFSNLYMQTGLRVHPASRPVDNEVLSWG